MTIQILVALVTLAPDLNFRGINAVLPRWQARSNQSILGDNYEDNPGMQQHYHPLYQ